jgi:hypothetical protein
VMVSVSADDLRELQRRARESGILVPLIGDKVRHGATRPIQADEVAGRLIKMGLELSQGVPS